MDAPLQRRIQRYGWDKAADVYEQFWQRQLTPAQDRLLALAALRPGERVVDVACGTGLVALRAAGIVGPSGIVVGTDISERMVAHAQAAAIAGGLRHARFARLDAEDLHDLPARAFDAALCALGLMYVPDPARALAEMARLLVPGGRTVVAVWGRRERCGWAPLFEIVAARVRSEVCPLFFGLGAPDALAGALRAVGYTNVVIERLDVSLTYSSGDEACGAAFLGGPVALAYARFDAATRAAVEAEYLAALEPYRTAAGYALPGEFVVARGERP
jgi:ubiquinone/menaquinone biosynthesis C-methylase UbiE